MIDKHPIRTLMNHFVSTIENLIGRVGKTRLGVLGWLMLIFIAGCDGLQSVSDRTAYSDANVDFAGVGSYESSLAGEIKIEGSSTVEPISIIAAQQFNSRYPKVNLLISGKGTSNGFAALAKQEIDISNASRPIRSSEIAACRQQGNEVIELPIAYDGITVVVNPQNNFIQQLSIVELTRIFREDQAAEYWSEIDPTWPRQRIMIYAAGIASGTHDYFSNVISGETGMRIRSDDQVLLSEDDRLLVRAIRDDPYSIGFFGFHYYWMEQDNLRAVKIVNPAGIAVPPTLRTITSGQYVPFSRPLFFVANLESCQRLEVKEFVDFFLSHGRQLVQLAGYVPFDEVDYARTRDIFHQRLLEPSRQRR